MKAEESTVAASVDGYKLHVYDWSPDGDSSNISAAMVIVHGLAEHAARYSRVAETLTESGIAVSAADLRGHGKIDPDGTPGRGIFTYSASSAAAVGKKDGWAVVAEDVRDMIRRMKDRYSDVPLFLLGHSMGSLLAQQVLVDGGEAPAALDGAVLSGSNSRPPRTAALARYIARFERLRLGGTGTSEIIDKLSAQDWNSNFMPTRTSFDWLSRDEAEVNKYITDVDCGFLCSVQLWIDVMDNLPKFTSAAAQRGLKEDLPILIFSGDRDPVGSMGSSVRALADCYEKAGVKSVTCKLYEGARHETLNETNRDEVTKDLIAWMERVIVSKRQPKE